MTCYQIIGPNPVSPLVVCTKARYHLALANLAKLGVAPLHRRISTIGFLIAVMDTELLDRSNSIRQRITQLRDSL